VSYCINPKCPSPDEIPDDTRDLVCPHCNSKLVLNDRYRVTHLLGSGGFGKTFEAMDGKACVVVKVLYRNHPKAVELFKQEAKVLCRLDHPGIPRVEEDGYFVYWVHGTTAPLHCLVMEKIEGKNLVEWLDSRGGEPIDADLARTWLEQLVDILDRVHQLHYFHRDIKPHNIMRRPDGQLALIDFGTAREVTGTYINKVGGGQNVTEIISAGYTPPEQINGKAVPQSDFYALGRTFVYLMTGKKPTHFPENPRNGKLLWHDAAPHIPAHFASVIDYMMAPFPGNRPQHGRVIFQALDDSQPGGTWEMGDTNALPPRSNRPNDARWRGRRSGTDSSLRTGSRLRSSRSIRTSRTKVEAWLAEASYQLSRLSWPEISWQRVGIGAAIALALSQVYGYWRYGFFPANPARLVLELPDSLFYERPIARRAGYVRSLALSPNGQRIASGSFGTLRVWNTETGELQQQRSGHQDWIEAIAFLDNNRIATAGGGKDGTIRIWNAETGIRQLTLGGHSGGTNALILTPDRQTMIGGGGDRAIRLWKVADFAQTQTLGGHVATIDALAVSSDGNTLASGSRNGTIRLWDLQRGVQLRALQGHSGRILSLAFAPDGRTLASSSADRSVRIWDILSGEQSQSLTDFSTPVDHLVYLVNALPDRPTAEPVVQLLGTTRSILVWQPETGERVHSLWGSRSPFSALATTASGDKIVTGSPQETIQLWRLPDVVAPPPP